MLNNLTEKGICIMKRFVLLAGKILGILKFHSNQFIKRCWGIHTCNFYALHWGKIPALQNIV